MSKFGGLWKHQNKPSYTTTTVSESGYYTEKEDTSDSCSAMADWV